MPPTCPKCGAELVPEKRVCPTCGAAHGPGEYEIDIPADGAAKVDPGIQAGEPSRRGCLVLGAVALLVLAAVAGRAG